MGNLYDNIKSLCDVKGVKPATMCREVGLNPNLPTDLKAGRKKSVRAETAAKIANYFGVTVNELLYGQKEKPTEDGELNEYLDMLRDRPGLRALLKVHKGSTDEEIEANVRFIEQLRKEHD